MNWELDEFLDHVDQWKFKLHDDLSKMTAAEKAKFWRASLAKAKARGLPVFGEEFPPSAGRKTKRQPKRLPRARRRKKCYVNDGLLNEAGEDSPNRKVKRRRRTTG